MVGQGFGHRDLDFHEQVALASSHLGEPLVSQAEDLSVLGARRDRHLSGRSQRRSGDFSSESRRGVGHRHLYFEVVSLSLELGMGKLTDDDIEITRLAVCAHDSSPRHSKLLSVGDPSGDGDFDLSRGGRRRRTLAGRTLFQRRLARASAGFARLLHPEESLGCSGSVTDWTRLRIPEPDITGAIAALAGILNLVNELSFGARIDLFERQVDDPFDIRRLYASGSSHLLGSMGEVAEELLEEAGIAPEIFLAKVESSRASMSLRISFHVLGGLPLSAVLIVEFPLLGVAENLVRLAHFFELGFSGLIVGIDVRVVLSSELSISRFDLLLIGVLRNSQDVIVVARHCCLNAQ